MGKIVTKRQVACFVEKGKERRLGYWIEYRLRGRTRSHIAVLKAVPALLPPSKIGLGHEAGEFDVAFDDIRPWLEARGYRILGAAAADCTFLLDG